MRESSAAATANGRPSRLYAAFAARLPATRLIAISATALFLEMALIRFINSTVQVVAYFNNFVILATFLGLGFGALSSARWPRLFSLAPVVLCTAVAGLVWFERNANATFDISDLVAWIAAKPESVALPSGLVVCLVFIACFVVFAPLGNELGRCLEQFPDRLQAYGYDLLGSITGVAAFALVSWNRLPPTVWFGVAGVMLGWLLYTAGVTRVALGWRILLLLASVWCASRTSPGFYSPYYKIQLAAYTENGNPKPTHYSVFVDQLRIQDAIDFDQDLSKTTMAAWLPYYQLPYKIRPQPARVLVLGGGSGNDTAVALKAGAKHVDVVEVDPILVGFGHRIHPQRPYADPRVHAINDDARAFLRRSTGTYDLIVMNALDSHHQLPGLSTLRLESFIYTVQAFEDVRRHMRDDSVFVVNLSSTRPWMGERLFWSLTKAFNRRPALFGTPDSPFRSVAFVYGPDKTLAAARDPAVGLLAGASNAIPLTEAGRNLATDDWPHLYLASPRIPALYYQVLFFVVLLTVVCWVALTRSHPERVTAAPNLASSLHFLLLGASFMLLETRAITQFALLFGSTWIINAIVIGSILIVVYLGNRLLQGRATLSRANKTFVFAALLASLIALFFIPLDSLLPLQLGWRIAGAAFVIGAPVFAASLIFSDSFRSTPNASAAFGANLVGVVLGGALEYTSMQFGLKFLYLIAATLYALAWLADRLSHTRPAAQVLRAETLQTL